ncbi:hypothetical protein JCM9279_002812 [Rhodotorula babjevae]
MTLSPSLPHPPPAPPLLHATRPSRPPVHLPDEIILDIIDWCDHLDGARPIQLPYERNQTLAVVCRLAKRFRANAERVLYSRVAFWSPSAESALHVLYDRPDLRPHVRAVDFAVLDAGLDGDERIAHVMRDLPNLDEVNIRTLGSAAQAMLFSASERPLRRVRIIDPQGDVRPLLRQHARRLAHVKELHIASICGDPGQPLRPIELVELASLSTSLPRPWDTFATCTAVARAKLVHVTLPLSQELGTYRLDVFPLLKSLHLHDTTGTGYGLCRPPSSADLVALLRTSRSLTSFALEGDLSRASSPTLDPPFAHVLAALPPSLKHLALLTCDWGGTSRAGPADAAAAYLVGRERAPALRSVRIGGANGVVAERFRALWVRRAAGEQGEMMRLVDWLEEEGVAVTTVAERSAWPTESSR